MTPRYLLDTNICIFIRRERPAAVLDRFRQHAVGEVAMSAITYGELFYGVFKGGRANPERGQEIAKAFETLSRLIPVLELRRSAGMEYGYIRDHLHSKGTPIGGNDLWIAAHALDIKAVLVTNNRREFDRVPGLLVEDWTT